MTVYAQRRAKGLCGTCGKREPVLGKAACQACRDSMDRYRATPKGLKTIQKASAKQYADAVADYVERMEATTPSWVPICRDDE